MNNVIWEPDKRYIPSQYWEDLERIEKFLKTVAPYSNEYRIQYNAKLEEFYFFRRIQNTMGSVRDGTFQFCTPITWHMGCVPEYLKSPKFFKTMNQHLSLKLEDL